MTHAILRIAELTADANPHLQRIAWPELDAAPIADHTSRRFIVRWLARRPFARKTGSTKRTLTLWMLAAVSICAALPVKAADWTPWNDLAKFKPDGSALIAARTARGHAKKDFDVQKIGDGSGDAVNVDEYAVRVSTFPNGWNRTEFLKYVRSNLNNFFDQNVAEFRPYSSGDNNDWLAETNAQLGTIVVFKIKVGLGTIDDGAVVVSQTANLTWIFSPIEDGVFGDFGTHPVAGNRQLGVREVSGGVEFFTRAFDRVYPTHVALNEGAAFKGADDLWKSMQRKLTDYINSHGGSAEIVSPVVPGGNNPGNKPQYSAVCADPAIDLEC